MSRKSPTGEVARNCAVTCLLLLIGPSAGSAQVGFCRVEGVSAGKIYNHPVTIKLADPVNQAGASITVDGKPYVSGRRIEEDGHYYAEVRSVGPVVTSELCEPVTFTIDRTPPTIALTRPYWLPDGAMPRIEVVDDNPNPKGVKVILDGKPYDPGYR